MSIWAGGAEIGRAEDDVVLTYSDGWSNHYPTPGVERPAVVGLSEVPPWCVPGHRDDTEAEAPGPWLRMHLFTQHRGGAPGRIERGATVLLSPEAARALAAELVRWADLDHTRPEGEDR